MSISVVYLARGKSAEKLSAIQFINSYQKYQSGCDHILCVVMKGWEKDDMKEYNEFRRKFLNIGAKIFDYDDDGFDWGAYMRVAKEIDTDSICFLNCYSRILADNWLRNFENSLNIENVGMSGATGSHRAWKFSMPLFQWDFSSIVLYPFSILNRLKMHFLLKDFYPSKFSPHLRSNGFVIKRHNFLKFIKNKNIPKTKLDCYKLESGLTSLSNFIIKNGERLLLVDRNGKTYDIEDWPMSKTYCSFDQDELCIADNNTDLYMHKNLNKKRKMEYEAWGRKLS